MFGGNSKKRNSTGNIMLLEICDLVAAADGRLWIRPLSPTLTAAELGGILQALKHSDLGSTFQQVVFDLSRVEMMGPQWTVILAMLMDFARQTAARCRIASLKEQPAAVVRLYRLSTELMRLIAWDHEARLAA
jgi:anti-anti-sigma regulatory factor